MSFVLSPYRFALAGFTNFSSEAFYQASDKAANDAFGHNVAISGDGNTIAVGAPTDDNSIGTNAGSVYIFVRGSGNNWTEQARIQPTSGGLANGQLGFSVALSDDGNTLVAGAPSATGTVQGKAWVFTRSGSTWSQHTDLYAAATTVPGADILFGNGVAINSAGDTIAVGAPWGGGTDGGRVWCFALSGGVWTQQAGDLIHGGAGSTDYMGQGLALSDDGNVLVAATRKFKAEIFKRTGSSWAHSATLTPASPPGGTFPSTVRHSAAISGDGKRAFVPCSTATVSVPSEGCVYEFTESGGTWTETSGFRFTMQTPASGANYGLYFAMNNAGNRAAIGGEAGFGKVEIWSRSGATWTRNQLITPTAGGSDFFGPCSLSNDGLLMAVGASGSDTGVSNAGGLFTFM